MSQAACNADNAASFFPRARFRRVVCVGDVHGDITALWKCLRLADVAQYDGPSQSLSWTAPEKTALVLLGDLVDRYREGSLTVTKSIRRKSYVGTLGEQENEEEKILELLNRLAVLAPETDGAVFRLFGNHEFLQMRDPAEGYQAKYATPLSMLVPSPTAGGISSGARRRQEDFVSGRFQHLIGSCSPKAVLQIGSSVFVHGGMNTAQIGYVEANYAGVDILSMANRLALRKWTGALEDGTLDAEAFDLVINGLGTRDAEISRMPAEDIERMRTEGTLPMSGLLWDEFMTSPDLPTGTGKACQDYAKAVLSCLNKHFKKTSAPNQTVKRFVLAHCLQSSRGKDLDNLAHEPRAAVRTASRTVYTAGEKVGDYHIDAENIAQGITTQPGGIVWRIDVGMSRAFRSENTDPDLTAEEIAAIERAAHPSVLVIDHLPSGKDAFSVLVDEAGVSDEEEFKFT